MGDYENLALEALNEAGAAGDPTMCDFALRKAQVYATLAVARACHPSARA